MRSSIYNALISKMTAAWYAAVIERLPRGAQVLDVGVGTGRALLANRNALMSRNIHVTGIDIDRNYIDTCLAAVAEAGLSDRIEPRLESVYDHSGGPYDAVYFSASFMLLPNPEAALAHVSGLLKPEGRLFFTQTFEHQRSSRMERLKPLLKLLTTIDFGQVTYEDDFLATLERADVDVIENVVIEARSKRSYKLIVALPAIQLPDEIPAESEPAGDDRQEPDPKAEDEPLPLSLYLEDPD